MADLAQLELIKKGSKIWNRWRIDNPNILVDLTGADLSEMDLRSINLRDAELVGAKLNSSNLIRAKFTRANLTNAELIKAKLDFAILLRADLTGAILYEASLFQAILGEAILSKSNLRFTNMWGADLVGATIHRADFYCANLTRANLFQADLRDSEFVCAELRVANLRLTDLRGADFTLANLQSSILVGANLDNSTLSFCQVYGISAWSIKGVPKDQTGLSITPEGEARITVDSLQLAQFIYLLVENQNIRNVIDTVTSKTVLILGSFAPERKKILEVIRSGLHSKNYVAIIFDFDNSRNQSLLETVMTLAGMSRFIIADVTAAKMVREELRSVVEKYPAKPIQPIILQDEQEYVTLPELRKGFKNVLRTLVYKDEEGVNLKEVESMIDAPERWLEVREGELANKTHREIELEKEIEELKKKLE